MPDENIDPAAGVEIRLILGAVTRFVTEVPRIIRIKKRNYVRASSRAEKEPISGDTRRRNFDEKQAACIFLRRASI